MSCWQILGIAPTVDERQIKKAYAVLLRKHNPEEDAKGYQQLREAFDSALKQAKYLRQSKASDESDRDDCNEEESTPPQNIPPVNDNDTDIYFKPRLNGFFVSERSRELPPLDEKPLSGKLQFYFNGEYKFIFEQTDRQEESKERVQQHVENDKEDNNILSASAFMYEANQLYHDYRQRINPSSWDNLIRRIKPDETNAVFHGLLKFLTCHYYLPQKVFVALDGYFKWSENRRIICDSLNPYCHDFIKRMINTPGTLHYDAGLVFSSYEECEQFFCERAKALTAIRIENISDAQEHIENALAFSDADRDLLIMAYDFYSHHRDYKQALKCCSRLIEFNPSDTEFYYFYAAALYDMGNYSHALEYCRSLLASDADNIKALCLAGKCAEKLNHEDVESYYIHAHSFQNWNMEPLLYFARIYPQLKRNQPIPIGKANRQQIKKFRSMTSAFFLPPKIPVRLPGNFPNIFRVEYVAAIFPFLLSAVILLLGYSVVGTVLIILNICYLLLAVLINFNHRKQKEI